MAEDRVDLSQYDGAYADAPNTASTDPVPDGTYQVIVESVELGRSKAGGNPMLTWELNVIGGPFDGRKMWRRNMIINDENVRWLKADLYMAGLELARLSDLNDNLKRLLDVKLEVKQVTKGDFTNVYFRKRIDTGTPPTNRATPESEGYVAPPKEEDKEDIPF